MGISVGGSDGTGSIKTVVHPVVKRRVIRTGIKIRFRMAGSFYSYSDHWTPERLVWFPRHSRGFAIINRQYN
jgi:hypothetical protein